MGIFLTLNNEVTLKAGAQFNSKMSMKLLEKMGEFILTDEILIKRVSYYYFNLNAVYEIMSP